MKKYLLLAAVGFLMLACNENVPSDPNQGMLNGLFSVSDTQQVHFAQGNLQYQPSTNTWRFATNQYDTIGSANENRSVTYDGWIDLFGWGTGNNPTYSSNNLEDYSQFVDWGINPISNGGNKPNLWRTLTIEEWAYLLLERTNADSLCSGGCVNGVNGMIFLPDNWILPYGVSFSSCASKGFDFCTWMGDQTGNGIFSYNTYTEKQWKKMEENGAVFLPVTGYMNGSNQFAHYDNGHYWSSTSPFPSSAGQFMFWEQYIKIDPGNYGRPAGFSVRLVK